MLKTESDTNQLKKLSMNTKNNLEKIKSYVLEKNINSIVKSVL